MSEEGLTLEHKAVLLLCYFSRNPGPTSGNVDFYRQHLALSRWVVLNWIFWHRARLGLPKRSPPQRRRPSIDMLYELYEEAFQSGEIDVTTGTGTVPSGVKDRMVGVGTPPEFLDMWLKKRILVSRLKASIEAGTPPKELSWEDTVALGFVESQDGDDYLEERLYAKRMECEASDLGLPEDRVVLEQLKAAKPSFDWPNGVISSAGLFMRPIL